MVRDGRSVKRDSNSGAANTIGPLTLRAQCAEQMLVMLVSSLACVFWFWTLELPSWFPNLLDVFLDFMIQAFLFQPLFLNYISIIFVDLNQYVFYMMFDIKYAGMWSIAYLCMWHCKLLVLGIDYCSIGITLRLSHLWQVEWLLLQSWSQPSARLCRCWNERYGMSDCSIIMIVAVKVEGAFCKRTKLNRSGECLLLSFQSKMQQIENIF